MMMMMIIRMFLCDSFFTNRKYNNVQHLKTDWTKRMKKISTLTFWLVFSSFSSFGSILNFFYFIWSPPILSVCVNIMCVYASLFNSFLIDLIQCNCTHTTHTRIQQQKWLEFRFQFWKFSFTQHRIFCFESL